MKIGTVICGPDVAYGPLALLSGSFEEKVRKAAALGYQGIELMVRDPAGLDWPAVKGTLAAAGLEVPQVVTGELFGADGLCLATTDASLYARAEQRTRAVIDLAAYLGAIVNIGRLRGRLEWLGGGPDAWRTAAERIGRVAEYAAEQGVRIALEPLNRYETDFLYTAADGMRLIGELGLDNLGLMLDVFHMNIEETGFAEGFLTAGDRLWHVHVADSNRNYPGSGHMPFGEIFAALRAMGYQGYVSAELRPLPDPDTAAEKTAAYLRSFDLSGV
jgi:sugar phosphate isomerase/epimerase